MKKIEIELKDLFNNPIHLSLVISQLNTNELYKLIGCSFIGIIRQELNGKDIELGKPDEIKQSLNRIWKRIEKDLLLSYNICGK